MAGFNYTCDYCGVDFTTVRQRKGKRTLCSVACMGKWRSEYCVGEKASNYKGILKVVVCPVCGKTFKQINRGSKYCSWDCQYRAIGKRDLYCTNCGAKLQKKPSVYRNKNGWHFCSKECSNEYCSGERSAHWIEDRTKLKNEYHSIRMSKPFAEWREAVFERDNYTCQICTARSGRGKAVELHPHHIKSFAEYPEDRFNINNGITLCVDCHKWIHEAGNLLAGRITP